MARWAILQKLHSLLTWTRASFATKQTVECPEVLFRALLRKNHLDRDGNLTEEAFMLRKTDEGHLSVFREQRVGLDQCMQSFERPPLGAASLHTGRVRSINTVHPLSIDVIPTESQNLNCPGHASIINLPDRYRGANRDDAERVASLLRDQARRVR
jgi:hypothetical protein